MRACSAPEEARIAVAEQLVGERTHRDMREAIREGFPPANVEELMRASGLTLKELASADLSQPARY
jgi:hypothetical protein